jgi:hypothetical protein
MAQARPLSLEVIWQVVGDLHSLCTRLLLYQVTSWVLSVTTYTGISNATWNLILSFNIILIVVYGWVVIRRISPQNLPVTTFIR